MRTKKAKKIIGKIIFFLVLGFFLFVTLLPLLWVLMSSLRSDEEIFRYAMPFSIHTFIPDKFTFQSYINIFKLRGFGQALFNTVIVGVASIVLGMFINAVAGYIFAKYEFKFKKQLFFLVMISFMVPFEAVAIPLYQMVNQMGLVDTYWVLIIPTISNGLIIFLFKQFFEEIPDSLIESARLEGANLFVIFTRIIIPLSGPVMVSAGLMIFVWQWESFLWPLISARSENLRMVQVALTDFKMQYQTLWSEMLAACMVSTILPVAFLIPLQKYYVQGIAGTGVKE